MSLCIKLFLIYNKILDYFSIVHGVIIFSINIYVTLYKTIPNLQSNIGLFLHSAQGDSILNMSNQI